MDINQVNADVAQDEEGAPIPINKKNGDAYVGADGKPTTITVKGAESQAYKLARADIQRKLLRRRSIKIEPADLLANRIEQAAAVVTDWSGVEQGGKPWPCTPENVKALLSVEHILEQVEDGISRHADFFAKS